MQFKLYIGLFCLISAFRLQVSCQQNQLQPGSKGEPGSVGVSGQKGSSCDDVMIEKSKRDNDVVTKYSEYSEISYLDGVIGDLRQKNSLKDEKIRHLESSQVDIEEKCRSLQNQVNFMMS